MGTMFQFFNPGAETVDDVLFNLAVELGVNAERRFPDGTDLTPLYDEAVDPSSGRDGGCACRHQRRYDAALYNFDTTAGEDGAADLADGLNAAFAPTAEAGLESITTSNFIINNLVVTTLRDSQVSSLLLTLTAALLLLVINFWFESRRPMLGVITTLPLRWWW